MLESLCVNYEQTVANYRQTVLTAFQEVESNLALVNAIAAEAQIQNQFVRNVKNIVKYKNNQYQEGMIALAELINSEIEYYDSLKNEIIVKGYWTIAAVGLVKSLGGIW